MNYYNAGDIADIGFTIYAGDGVLYDPATVIFRVRSPNNDQYTYTYGMDDEATKVSTGVYRLLFSIPYQLASFGTWSYNAQGLDADDNSLIVEMNSFGVTVDKVLS